MVETCPFVLDVFLENLGQSRRGLFGRESPMMSMTVMLFSAEIRHFSMMLDREGSPGLLMIAHVFLSHGVLAHEVLEDWSPEGSSILPL
jgi:hypothetical protein